MSTIFKDIITLTFGPFISTIALITLWNTLNNDKKKHIFSFAFMYIFGIINNTFVPRNIKAIVYIIGSFITVKLTYKNKISKCINTVLVQALVSALCELIIMIPLSIFANENIYNFLSTRKGEVIVDVMLGTIVYLCAKSKIPSYLNNFINKTTKSIKDNKKLLFTIIFIISVNSISYFTVNHYNTYVILIVNIVLIIIYTLVIFYLFKIENNSIQINNKYNFNLNVLMENEKILKEYKTNSHEYKNTIRTIKNMIEINDPNVLDFINSTIKDLNSNDKKILEESSKIPLSGLKSLVHSKLTLMKENKIKYSIYIDKKIKNLSINNDTTLDICKIIGVFLDNAIEEVKNNKVKKINIYMYQDKDLFIEISNNYQNISFKSKKGKNRGYGLKLVEQIINENSILSNERRITNNIFTQILKIKST